MRNLRPGPGRALGENALNRPGCGTEPGRGTRVEVPPRSGNLFAYVAAAPSAAVARYAHERGILRMAAMYEYAG
jgi:hypothetical protein